MAKNLLFRILDAIPTILLVLVLVFVAMRILPGDPALAALGDMATAQQVESLREQMGLNQPLWKQFIDFLLGIFTLDFGTSLSTGRSVTSLLAYNLPYTIELTIAAMIMGIAIGMPLGIWAAIRRNKLPDHSVRAVSLGGYAIPDFYLGALLLIVFSLNLRLFPISGGGGADFIARMHHLFLPALTLALIKTALISRLTRGALLEVMSKDFVRTARAKGAKEVRVIYLHGLRNAMLPISTGLGLSLLATLSGSVAIEMVFNRPGVGKLLVDAIAERDYAVIQGGVIVFALFVLAINLIMDLVYLVVDPRIREK